MSEETNPVNPLDLPLPKDYEDDLDNRLPKPIISSTENSDDEDKRRSGEITPINTTTPKNPIPPVTLAILQNYYNMSNQATGGNTQQIGDGTNSITVAPNTINIANVTDRFEALSIDSQKASYLAPDDIVKKYKELEIQYKREKVYNGKVMCAILDFVKTLKDPPQELDKFVEEIKKDEKQVTQLCDSQELSLTKAKEISELYSQPIEYPTFKKPDNTVNPNQLNYAKSAKEIVTAVGVFDPLDKSHNFTQTWFCFITESRIFSLKKTILTCFSTFHVEMQKPS
jgi:hypothetical protein